jgi:hypothetical protein
VTLQAYQTGKPPNSETEKQRTWELWHSQGATGYTEDSDDLRNFGDSHHSVPVFDHCRASTERAGGGFSWSIRRNGVADRIWSARFGDGAFACDYLGGNHVYGDVVELSDFRDKARVGNQRKRARQQDNYGSEAEESATTEAAIATGNA